MTMRRFTTIPAAWHGRDLFRWRDGYRVRGYAKLPGPHGRPRAYFAWDGSPELSKIRVGTAPRLIRQIRQMTREVWIVHERNGKYWHRSFYFVPTQALRAISDPHRQTTSSRELQTWSRAPAKRRFTPGMASAGRDTSPAFTMA